MFCILLFSRWRFTFYLSIFLYGIRFLWTVSWSGTPLLTLPPGFSVCCATGFTLQCWNFRPLTTVSLLCLHLASKKRSLVISHLCVPLFEILEFLCKGHFDSMRKLLNKSVIMEILEVYLLLYTRIGQTWLLGVERFCFLPIGIHIYLWVFIIRAACFFEFRLRYNLPLGAEWLFQIIILSYSKFSLERR